MKPGHRNVPCRRSEGRDFKQAAISCAAAVEHILSCFYIIIIIIICIRQQRNTPYTPIYTQTFLGKVSLEWKKVRGSLGRVKVQFIFIYYISQRRLSVELSRGFASSPSSHYCLRLRRNLLLLLLPSLRSWLLGSYDESCRGRLHSVHLSLPSLHFSWCSVLCASLVPSSSSSCLASLALALSTPVSSVHVTTTTGHTNTHTHTHSASLCPPQRRAHQQQHSLPFSVSFPFLCTCRNLRVPAQ